jgi:hypothetical protein
VLDANCKNAVTWSAWARLCVETLSEKHRFRDWVPSRAVRCVKKFGIETAFSDLGTASNLLAACLAALRRSVFPCGVAHRRRALSLQTNFCRTRAASFPADFVD